MDGDNIDDLRVRFLDPFEHELTEDETFPSFDTLAIGDYSPSMYSSQNVEENGDSLTVEVATALLGKHEYQIGNVENALQYFERIDVAAVTPKMILSIAWIVENREGIDVAAVSREMKLSIPCWRLENHKRHSPSDAAPAMSMHTVNVLSKAIFLKSKSLQALGRYRDAAQSCKVLLDIFESASPEGLPENFGTESKWLETLNNAVQLLPELWKLAGFPHEAILSYRRALLHRWNLDVETTARIEKEFAIFLLHSGCDANPPDLRYQTEGSFVPRNNLEEAVLLLMTLSRHSALERIEMEPSVITHLSFALSLSGHLRALANHFEGFLPGILLDRTERYYILALCYHGVGDDMVALSHLRDLLSKNGNPRFLPGLLLASKIYGENPGFAQLGEKFARRALSMLEDLGLLQDGCDQMESVANCLLGVSLSAEARSVVSDSERTMRESEALKAFETAEKTMKERDPKVFFHLSLENAERRRLNVALDYAMQFLKLEADSNIKGWILLARIFSAQKRYEEAVSVIDAGLAETGQCDLGDLLRTKAKLQIAQDKKKNAIATYNLRLLAALEVQSKRFGVGKKFQKGSGKHDRSLEMEACLDLANVYTSLSMWEDAEIYISKAKAIRQNSASQFYATGLLHQAKGQLKEALEAFGNSLALEPTHVPSLISSAAVRMQLGHKSFLVKSFLQEALQLDPKNTSAWRNLGILLSEGGPSSQEASAECFQTADRLQESEPAEPFR